jgi:hypothetical protein
MKWGMGCDAGGFLFFVREGEAVMGMVWMGCGLWVMGYGYGKWVWIWCGCGCRRNGRRVLDG